MDMLQDLAHAVINICPSGYNQAKLEAELDDDWARLDLRCIDDSGGETRALLKGGASLDLHDQLDIVRDEMARATGYKWKKCIFVILPGGKFKLDVEY
jgi:hypothetical protein